MKHILAFVFIFCAFLQTSFAQTETANGDAYMKAVCEGLVRMNITADLDKTYGEKQWSFTGLLTSLVEPNHMQIEVTTSLKNSKKTSESQIIVYNCFKCLNRSLEQIVVTLDSHPDASCAAGISADSTAP